MSTATRAPAADAGEALSRSLAVTEPPKPLPPTVYMVKQKFASVKLKTGQIIKNFIFQ